MGRGMPARGLARLRQPFELVLELAELLEDLGQRRHRAGVACPHLLQAVRGQPLPAGLEVGQGGIAFTAGPGCQGLDPAREPGDRELLAVPALLGRRRLRLHEVEHGLAAFDPGRAQLRQRGIDRGPAFSQYLLQRHRVAVERVALAQQVAHVLVQRGLVAPDLQQFPQRLFRQRIAFAPPVVLHRLGQQGLLVGDQFLVEQAAAVEGMFAQHALAPGIDGVHAGLVHALGGHRQLPGRLVACLLVGVVGQQALQERVGGRRRLAAKAACCFEQAGPDAVGQLARGCAREGHDQDLGRQ